jgi:hypothetical protein
LTKLKARWTGRQVAQRHNPKKRNAHFAWWQTPTKPQSGQTIQKNVMRILYCFKRIGAMVSLKMLIFNLLENIFGVAW